VVLRTCTVSVKDVRDTEHSIEVTAETLYEAIATALAALQQDSWVGEISQGFTTVSVLVQQPPVKHEVKMKGFLSWLNRQGRSPAEVILKQETRRITEARNRSFRTDCVPHPADGQETAVTDLAEWWSPRVGWGAAAASCSTIGLLATSGP
jgi:hypothetical protein